MVRRSAGQWVGTLIASLVVASCSADEDLSGATLTGASFHKIDLTGADFTDAVLAVDGGLSLI